MVQKKRLLVTRSLGPDVMPLLTERDDLEVRSHGLCLVEWIEVDCLIRRSYFGKRIPSVQGSGCWIM
jgi:hypothetical protein